MSRRSRLVDLLALSLCARRQAAHLNTTPENTFSTAVVYGADKTKWASLKGALKRGAAKDGDVTLVLERRQQQPSASEAV